MLWYKLLSATHVWLKNLRDAYRTVCIQIILKECNKHTRRCNYCIIQCICKILRAITSLYTDSKSTSLSISEIRAASYLEILLLSRTPRLYIAALYLEVCEVS